MAKGKGAGMLRDSFLIIVLLGVLLPSLVWADGMVVADPSVYFNLIEDQQIAVIEVKENKAVDVDLYISLVDTSGRSNEVKFILPFYSKPTTFEAREGKLEEFISQKVNELDVAMRWEKYFEEMVDLSFGFCGFFFGSYIPGYLHMSGLRMSSAVTEEAEKVVTTEHSKTMVYRLGSERELDKILKQSGLPEKIKEKLKLYKRDYLYITTINTIPYKRDKYGKIDSFGIHFSSTSRLEREVSTFSYPLSTGQTWGNPIRLTRIYVTSPYGVGLNVRFPIYGEKVSDQEMAEEHLFGAYYYLSQIVEYTRSGKREKLKELTKPYCSMEEVNTGEFKAYRAIYTFSNPDEDVEIRFFNTRLDFLSLAAWEGSTLILERFLSLPVNVFIILGIVIWILLFRFIPGRDLGSIYSFRGKRLYLDSLLCLIIYMIFSFLGWGVHESGFFEEIITLSLIGGLWVFLFILTVRPSLKPDYSLRRRDLYRDIFALGVFTFFIVFVFFDSCLWWDSLLTPSLIFIFATLSWLYLFNLIVKRHKRAEYQCKKALFSGLSVEFLCISVSCLFLLLCPLELFFDSWLHYSCKDRLKGLVYDLTDPLLELIPLESIDERLSDIIYKSLKPDLLSHGAKLSTITIVSSILLPPVGIFVSAIVLKKWRRLPKLPFWPLLAVAILTIILYNLFGFGLAVLLKSLV